MGNQTIGSEPMEAPRFLKLSYRSLYQHPGGGAGAQAPRCASAELHTGAQGRARHIAQRPPGAARGRQGPQGPRGDSKFVVETLNLSSVNRFVKAPWQAATAGSCRRILTFPRRPPPISFAKRLVRRAHGPQQRQRFSWPLRFASGSARLAGWRVNMHARAQHAQHNLSWLIPNPHCRCGAWRAGHALGIQAGFAASHLPVCG